MDRYLERFERYEPAVAILGDAYTVDQAERLDRIAIELLEEHPQKRMVIVPKAEDIFDAISDDVILGVPIGYSDIHADDLGWQNYRGRDVHILGAAPDKAWNSIQKLTQPNLTGDPPADVKGLDWNGLQKVAYLGEYWTPNGWKRADELSIRETVRKGLEEVKAFWESKGVWPETEPVELYGPPVLEPDDLIFMDQGGDPIPDRESLEDAWVEEYRGYGKLAFSDEHYKKQVEYYEGLEPV